MSKRVDFRPRAARDVRRAARWYDRCQPGLGAEFEAEIETFLTRLEEHARHFRPYYQELHRVNLDRFPYRIFFLAEFDRILVVRVLHEKRDHPRHLLR
ncbi:MAG TPA: type II toxin-antitoxin system RelE/ParE family toxin [Candidatus Methylacidiphilales bacterium]|nr:type II toxin-antitoxin system RelE/ParE family toxin [Candidatus Methylacidiphilales bacterium]